jgi:predicted alpha-1,2-mannosidase
MGDFGYIVVCPGMGPVKPAFKDRGMPFKRAEEYTSPFLYKVTMSAGENGKITAQHTATSRVGFLNFHFSESDTSNPNVVIQATRKLYTGEVTIDPKRREISGYNPERQDYKLGPHKAENFKGYFVARFDQPFAEYGTALGAKLYPSENHRSGKELSAYVTFATGTTSVGVRIGTSFISIDQARENLDKEIPDEKSFESTVMDLKNAWAAKLQLVEIEGGTKEQLTNFYTGIYHALQYPSEMNEYGRYYSGYVDKVLEGESAYTAYSIWDTFRAETAFLTLFAPERIDGMTQSMLQVFQQSGWLPMWQNPVETNIMVGTHADSILAEVLAKGFRGFDLQLAWEAVHKDATIPPDWDLNCTYYDREEYTPVEARAGLTMYLKNGWVAAEYTAESASRTLDYAYDDYAVSVVAEIVGKKEEAEVFRERSGYWRNVWREKIGFMNARYANGTWANETVGWTEGDHWVYTFDVMHDIPGLVDLMGK